MRRVVFDTTVLVSAFLTPGGLSDELLDLANQGRFELVLARAIIGETRRKLLTSSRIRKRYRYSDRAVGRYCRELRKMAEVVVRPPPMVGIVRDPEDDMIVACAMAGRANAIVSRDKDLLSIGIFQSIAIITPELFRQRLREQDKPA